MAALGFPAAGVVVMAMVTGMVMQGGGMGTAGAVELERTAGLSRQSAATAEHQVLGGTVG